MYHYNNKIRLFCQVSAGALFMAACSPLTELHNRQLVTLTSNSTEEEPTPTISLLYQQVFEAASTNNRKALEYLFGLSLKMSPIINITLIRDEKGNTPLHVAAAENATDVVEWLINLNPKCVRNTNNAGKSALDLAVLGNYPGPIAKLAEAGATIGLGASPTDSSVYHAVKEGHLPTLERLFCYLDCESFIRGLMDQDAELAGFSFEFQPKKYHDLLNALQKFQAELEKVYANEEHKKVSLKKSLNELRNAFNYFTVVGSQTYYPSLIHFEGKLKRLLDQDPEKTIPEFDNDEEFIIEQIDGCKEWHKNLFKPNGPMANFFNEHRHYLKKYINKPLPCKLTFYQLIQLFAIAGNLQGVISCVCYGSKVWNLNFGRCNPLLLAIDSGNKELVEYLLPLTRKEVKQFLDNPENKKDLDFQYTYEEFREELVTALESIDKEMLELVTSYWPTIFKTDLERRYVYLSNAILSKEPGEPEAMINSVGVKLVKDSKKGIRLVGQSIESVNPSALRSLLNSGAEPDLDSCADFINFINRYNNWEWNYIPGRLEKMSELVDILHKRDPIFPTKIIRKVLQVGAPIPFHSRGLYADLLTRYVNVNEELLRILNSQIPPDAGMLSLNRLNELFDQGPDDNWVLRYIRNQLPPFPFELMSPQQLAFMRVLIQKHYNRQEYAKLVHEAANAKNSDWNHFLLTWTHPISAQQYGYKRNNLDDIDQEEGIHSPVSKRHKPGPESTNNPKE